MTDVGQIFNEFENVHRSWEIVRKKYWNDRLFAILIIKIII